MLNFNKMEPGKVYRVKSKFTLPYNQRSQLKGNLITVLGDSTDNTIDFFKSRYLQFRRYSRYYRRRKLFTEFLGVQVRITNDLEVLKNEGFCKEFGTRYMMNPELVKDYNVVCDMGQYIQEMNNARRIDAKPVFIKADVKFDYIVKELNYITTMFPGHNKVMYIPIDKYISNPKDTTIWTKRIYLDNLIILLLRQFETNYAKIAKELSEWTFVFMNVNEMFYLRCKDTTADTYATIKSLFKRLRSRAGVADIKECDDEFIPEDDDVNEDVLKEANKSSAEKIIKNAISDMSSAQIDKTKKEEIIKTVAADVATTVQVKSTSPIKSIVKDTVVKQKDEPVNKPAKTKLISTKLLINDKEDNEISEPVEKESENKIISNDDLKASVNAKVKEELSKTILPKTSIQRLARTTKIQSEMENIKVNDESIKEIAQKAKSKQIEPHVINNDLINDKMKTIKFDNFARDYNKKLLTYDLTNILTSFSKKDHPLYLINLEKEDTSTVSDQLYTYTATFEDERGTRHTITFDFPKLVDDRFIHINGSDKLFISQLVSMPVIKTSPDEVQMTSDYNKMFIRRFGKVTSEKISRFNKLIPTIDKKYVDYVAGNTIPENTQFMTTIEYDELGMHYSTMNLKCINTILYFNQNEIRDIAASQNLEFDNDTELPVAIETLNNGDLKLICIDINTDKVVGYNDKSLIDFIVDAISNEVPSFAKEFNTITGGKKSIYTRASIMAKKVPIVLLLSFLDGLVPLLNRLKMEYTFYEKRPTKIEDAGKYGMIEFKDGYLVYNLSPYSNSLLMNGFYDIPTKEYNFLDFSSKDIYYDIFNNLFGRRNIGDAFENFNQSFIDPVTKEILEDNKLPTNFIDLVIYANSLLENNTYEADGNLINMRLRSNEMLNAHLYKILSKAYDSYRITANNTKPTKFSIKRKDLINDIFNSQVLEEYSTLNPIFEIDRMRSTSYKGVSGCNVDRAFKLEKRAFNDTMLGVMAQSTPVASNVGVSRVMSLDPNIKSLRGYIEPGDPNHPEKLNQANMFSGAEMLVCLGPTHDDPQRVSMTSIQSRHTIATTESDAPLFGYGMDKILANAISNRFAFKSKDDGVVAEINEKLGYMIVEYANGKRDVIDLTNRQALNTGSGFYITNKLTPVVNVGDKFDADKVLAINKEFFTYDKTSGSAIFMTGPLARVALMHGSFVYEDSTIVTQEFADKMSSHITEKKDILIGKNSNIYHIAKVGDEVKSGDPLLIFDDSYNDEFLNKLVEKMNLSDKERILEAGRTPIKSKYNGTVVDIKIYYTVPKTEMSDSLKGVISDYEKPIKERLNTYKKYGIDIRDLVTLNETGTVTEPVNGKINGTKMGDNEVLIEFYISTLDKFSVGDKLTFLDYGNVIY